MKKEQMNFMKVNSQNPYFEKLEGMKDLLKSYLETPPNSTQLQELLDFQDPEGSFNLLTSFDVPKDARVDFCYMPTHLFASILIDKYNKKNQVVKRPLKNALDFIARTGLRGHGYEAEQGAIDALKVFIKGGLKEFLEKENFCPAFSKRIENTLNEYKDCLHDGNTSGAYGAEYGNDMSEIVFSLTRYYLAYGSNMNFNQMYARCPSAKEHGKAYLENWKLTIPFYANIVKSPGEKTPVFIWKITASDEKRLDACEGVGSNSYYKEELTINIYNRPTKALVYIMTDGYALSHKQTREGYIDTIRQGYLDSGFEENEFKPFES